MQAAEQHRNTPANKVTEMRRLLESLKGDIKEITQSSGKETETENREKKSEGLRIKPGSQYLTSKSSRKREKRK